MTRPIMEARKTIAEQMPLTNEEIIEEIRSALAATGEMVKNFPEIKILVSNNKILLRVGKTRSTGNSPEEGAELNDIYRALDDVISHLKENGYEVKLEDEGTDSSGHEEWYAVN